MVAHDGETDGSAIVYRSAAVRRAANVVFRLAHAVVVQNEYQSEKIRGRYPRAAVVMHKKGVDSAAPAAGEPEYDAAWIGRFEPWKRPDMFVALARQDSSLRLLMVCAPVDGPREAFDRFMHEAAAPDNLKFIPGLPHDRISETLQSARAFCFTSEQEGDWPMVVLEAAACGLPVICAGAQYGGLVDAYGGGVACDSVAAMAAELQALKSDPDRCARMADGAMRYIREHHDMSGQAARLLDKVLEL